jgi:hypothetical protein
MNQSHSPTKKPTLTEVLALDDPEHATLRLDLDDLDLTLDERIETTNLWLHLTGFERGSALEVLAMQDVLMNSDLFIMLNMPACESVNWLLETVWWDFQVTLTLDSEEWCWAVLDRACAICADMGELALQMPLRAPRLA